MSLSWFSAQAELFKVLSHPRRLEIIHLIRDQELPVSDIQEMLDLPQANVSQHLAILRGAGVVQIKSRGKERLYRLSNKTLIEASDLIQTMIKQGSAHQAKFTDLLPLVTDPVCKMRLSPKTANFHTRHQDRDYYFCASGCQKLFQEESTKYVK